MVKSEFGIIRGAEVGTAEGDKLELLALVIKRYEDEYHPMPPSRPIAAILSDGVNDLEPLIGFGGLVSEVLNGMSLSVACALCHML